MKHEHRDSFARLIQVFGLSRSDGTNIEPYTEIIYRLAVLRPSNHLSAAAEVRMACLCTIELLAAPTTRRGCIA